MVYNDWRARSTPGHSTMSSALLRYLALALATWVLAGCGGAGHDTSVEASQASPAAGALHGKSIQATPSSTPTAAPGWYWNPAEGGTGFMFEAQGDRAFVGFFMYEAFTGKPIWYAAFGDMGVGDQGEAVFDGDLRLYRRDRDVTSTSVGAVRIAFTGHRAQVSLPGGRVMAAQRFDIAGQGHDFDQPEPASRDQPEAGWYWNPLEGGKGYAIEVQNGRMFLGSFHYHLDGSPTWDIVDTPLAAGTAEAPLSRYADGQSLQSTHRYPSVDTIGQASLRFMGPCIGSLRRDFGAGPRVPIQRFRVDGSRLPPGAECRDAATGRFPGPATLDQPVRLQQGIPITAELRSPGDHHVYAVTLPGDALEGLTYTIKLESAASGQGSLASPLLSVHDARGDLLPYTHRQVFSTVLFGNRGFCRTNASGPCFETYLAGIQRSGLYHIVVRAADGGTGTYRLVVMDGPTNDAALLNTAPWRYAGTVTGRLQGRLDITGDMNAAVTGTWTPAGGPGMAAIPLAGTVDKVRGSLSMASVLPDAATVFDGFLAPADGVYAGTWRDRDGPAGVFAVRRQDPPDGELQLLIAGSQRMRTGMPEAYRAASWYRPANAYSPMQAVRFPPPAHRWRLVSSPAASSQATLLDDAGQMTWFTADLPGMYTLELSVTEGNGRITTRQWAVEAVATPVLSFYDPSANPVTLAFVEPTAEERQTPFDSDVAVVVEVRLDGAPVRLGRARYDHVSLSSDHADVRVVGGPMNVVDADTARARFVLRSCTGARAQLTAVSVDSTRSGHTLPITAAIDVPPGQPRGAC